MVYLILQKIYPFIMTSFKVIWFLYNPQNVITFPNGSYGFNESIDRIFNYWYQLFGKI